ncbi:AMP-binding protein [Pseudoduganella namucuonensis]|uniref:Acyl-CoA synthetase (AMP-forming)/AMP-acid ligase II n=1 Tax=Pseudoduganella namucuonensis TaxID=1035707 RepID=A0A1I7IX14_9BURK|nr:AMP-binding protein [Pseudoduganella namucuonensis]SFU77507.1 Acyl-CoA synthetase (AMP-forming)/AMP-acid ligase II [Pseudoduganella namucuonensis]
MSMFDRLSLLPAALSARDPAMLAGWRDGAPVPCGEVATRMRAWAALLAGQPGRHYALYIEDSLEFAAALLGAWQAGKTVWLSADTLPASCDALALKVDGFLGGFPAALAPLRPGDACAVDAGASDGDADSDVDAAVVADVPFAGAGAALNLAAPALVVHTSGSTGAAQAIPKTLSQIDSEVTVLEQMFGARVRGAAVLATVSHQHIYGLLFKVLWPLCAGRPLHAGTVAYPEQLAELLAARPCVLVASPAHLKRLPDHLDWRGAAAQLRAVYSSGGPLPEDSAYACEALLGQAPIEVYGSSESGGVAWRQRAAGAEARHSGTWQAFPNVAWRVAEPEGALEVRSPHLPDDGWMTLADRVGHAAGGRFELLGRADRIVKVEEKRVSLDALERALAASPLVAEARVLRDEGPRAQLVAVVALTDQGRELLAARGKLALNRALRALLAEVAETVALPRRWRYPSQLPVNAQGKTTLAALQALFDDEAPEQGLEKDGEDARRSEPKLEPKPGLASRPRQPLPRELEVTPDKVVLELFIPEDLLYFEGHFPGAPILPGVAQLDWAVAYARRYFAPSGVFRDVAALKFQQVIAPGATVRAEFTYDAAKGSVQFQYLSAAGRHASGRIIFAPAA